MLFKALHSLNHYLTLTVIFPSLFALGLYFTFKLRGIQFTKIKLAFKHLLKKDPKSEGNISNFEALSAVLAGNLGTGNISGMAIALTLGGPGALVWMWIMATLGTVIKFAGCFLGLKYRTKTATGEYVGGPMYYLSKGLGFKKVAIGFALAAILTSLTVGNLVQVNSIFLPLHKMGVSIHLLVAALVVFTTFLLLGGLNRIAKVLGTLVPFMTAIYLLAALAILALHAQALPQAFLIMIKSAFSPSAFVGGTLGYGVIHAITNGFERGIFATDAGCGIAPILQSGAKCKEPILEGIVAMIAPFIVMVICSVTALVLIVTQASILSGAKSTNMCTWAFHKGLNHPIGEYIVIFSLILFAFTTIITWAYCGEKAIEFIASSKGVKYFKCFFILILPVGAYCNVEFAWLLADLSIGLMLIANLIGVFGLSREVIAETKEAFDPSKEASQLV